MKLWEFKLAPLTSKEALNNIIKTSCPQRTICEECPFKNRCNSFAKDWFDTIKKDLEILEILKRALTVEQHFEVKESMSTIGNITEYIIKENQHKLDTLFIKKLTEWIIKNVDKEKVKEWLENE